MTSVSLFGRPWRASDASGHPEIDREHRELLDAMGEVEKAIHARTPVAAVYERLADVVRACTEHFANEEVILDKIDYPHAPHHRREHAELAAKMQKLLRQHASGDLATMEMLTALFYEPLVLHMVRDDRAYYPYLQGA